MSRAIRPGESLEEYHVRMLHGELAANARLSDGTVDTSTEARPERLAMLAELEARGLLVPLGGPAGRYRVIM